MVIPFSIYIFFSLFTCNPLSICIFCLNICFHFIPFMTGVFDVEASKKNLGKIEFYRICSGQTKLDNFKHNVKKKKRVAEKFNFLPHTSH